MVFFNGSLCRLMIAEWPPTLQTTLLYLYKWVSWQHALLLISFSVSQFSFLFVLIPSIDFYLMVWENGCSKFQFTLCRLTSRAGINFPFRPQHPYKNSRERHWLALLDHVPWRYCGICLETVFLCVRGQGLLPEEGAWEKNHAVRSEAVCDTLRICFQCDYYKHFLLTLKHVYLKSYYTLEFKSIL